MINKKAQRKEIAIILGVIFLIVGAYFIFQNKGITGNVINNQEEVNQKNCKEVQVPYEEIETYIETVPYTKQECEDKELVYKISRGECKSYYDGWFSNTPASYNCTISNLDNERGAFSMRIGFNIKGQQLEETISKTIYPDSSETFKITREAEIDSCYCYETAPTKQVCRNVIDYKDIEKTKTVTKYRTEQQCN